MVDRPIKKADRAVEQVGEADLSLQNTDHTSINIPEETTDQTLEQVSVPAAEVISEQVKPISRVAAPVKLKDRTDKKADGQSEDETELKFGDRTNGSKPKPSDRGSERSNDRGSNDRNNDRGGDRNKRNNRSEEPRQPANLALLRGPKPTKPKVEEPPIEVEAELEQVDQNIEQNADSAPEQTTES